MIKTLTSNDLDLLKKRTLKEIKEHFKLEKINYGSKNGFSPLNYVCRFNPDLEIIRYFLDNGSNVNEQTPKGFTSLHLICKFNPSLGIVKLLIEAGSDVNSQAKKDITPLHLLCKYSPNIEIINFLVQNGASVMSKTIYKWNAFHFAARFNPKLDLIRCLIRHSHGINTFNNHHQTPLHLLCFNNKIEDGVVEYLIEKGANLELQNGKTPLILAKEEQNVIVEQKISDYLELEFEKQFSIENKHFPNKYEKLIKKIYKTDEETKKLKNEKIIIKKENDGIQETIKERKKIYTQDYKHSRNRNKQLSKIYKQLRQHKLLIEQQKLEQMRKKEKRKL
ncbi:molting protein mlt-4 [Anaeramoeba flamelloides]|uniref:Molting protein mlt-4 n=1 Tax=Anaeramoeba flamelloides TaxID=1746091 RepID=A0ABQ8Y2L1_9EUKA|nr:molting protein mlt-4 [Anaeramoeba flamelloides]